MAKNNSDAVQRAWSFLRLAFLWARKGKILRRRLTAELRLTLKKLSHSSPPPSGQFSYGERQLSFDETPIFHVKTHRPSSSLRFRIPRVTPPQVDFDYDFDGDEEKEDCCEIVQCEDDGIDLRAEEFIAKFYKQMRLQRQISYLQYQEMNNKSLC